MKSAGLLLLTGGGHLKLAQLVHRIARLALGTLIEFNQVFVDSGNRLLEIILNRRKPLPGAILVAFVDLGFALKAAFVAVTDCGETVFCLQVEAGGHLSAQLFVHGLRFLHNSLVNHGVLLA